MSRSTVCLCLSIAIAAAYTAGCTPAANTNTNVNSNRAVNAEISNSNASNSNASANTTGTSTAIGSLATPTDAYRTAYDLRKSKDIEGLKKVFSKDVLEFFAMLAEEEKKTLDEALRELAERPQAETAATRNEKIDGDRATLEYLSEKGDWKTMDFVKEGNDWKLTIPKADGPDDDEKKEPKKQP